jgi:hypothetical protein
MGEAVLKALENGELAPERDSEHGYIDRTQAIYAAITRT